MWDTDFQSYGLLAKYRRNIPSLKAKVITGVDIDYSPSQTTVNDITATADSTGTYTDYTVGTRVYDFDANQLGISPYIHAEAEVINDITFVTYKGQPYYRISHAGHSITAGAHDHHHHKNKKFDGISKEKNATYINSETGQSQSITDKDIIKNYADIYSDATIKEIKKISSIKPNEMVFTLETAYALTPPSSKKDTINLPPKIQKTIQKNTPKKPAPKIVKKKNQN